MKKSICLYFQVHQPTRLRQYRFFDIGKDSHYYDDFSNRTILKRITANCYLKMNNLLLEAIKRNNGKLKVAFSITGSALEQFDRYAPQVIDSFRALIQTGCVEILGETYYHSLASLVDGSEFEHQVKKHSKAIEEHFGVEPKAFRNTELIYSDAIGKRVYDLGFETMLTEGARHIMGWKSPNWLYCDEMEPRLKLLMRNYSLSDDIAFRFDNRGWNEWPLTAEKYIGWLEKAEGEVLNLFMDYETFGEHRKSRSGIFEFISALTDMVCKSKSLQFATPSEVAAKHKAAEPLDVSHPISWADEERDVTAWLGNELQSEAFNKLYELKEKLAIIDDADLWSDFGHLQESDHLYYMCTKFFSDGEIHKMFNPYKTPYEAFINYMNILSDFTIRVNNYLAEK